MSNNSDINLSLDRQSIAVVGVVKDVEKNLQENIDSVGEKLSGHDLQWVVVESNSRDKTREILEKNKSANSSFLYEVLDSGRSLIRLEAIARARQHALELLRKLAPSPNLVLVIDLDQKYDWKHINFPKTLVESDAVFAHQEPYYDLLAFKPRPNWVETSGYDYRPRKSFLGRVWNQLFVAPKWQLRLGKLESAMEVESAFGGAAMYSYETYVTGSYINGHSETGRDDICEHIVFHESLRKKSAKLVLDPDFKLPVRNEHSRLADLLLFAWKVVRR